MIFALISIYFAQERYRAIFTQFRNALFSTIGSRLWTFAHRSRKQRDVHGACENLVKAQSDGGSGLKKCLSLDEFDERN